MYNVRDHYWYVTSDERMVYGSARNIYVDPASDADFLAWTAIGNAANYTESEAGIWHLMQEFVPAFLWDGATFSQPGLDQYTKSQLTAYCKNARWLKEQGGLTLSTGKPIDTNDRAQAKINGAKLMALDKATTYNPNWQYADGTVVQINANAVIAMSNELQTHIDNCFNISAGVLAQITAGTITTLAQIDAAFG